MWQSGRGLDCGEGGGGSGGFKKKYIFNLNQKWFENLRSLKNILKFLFSGGTGALKKPEAKILMVKNL